jgi:hypothetical protein
MIREATKTKSERPTTVWVRPEWVAKVDDWRRAQTRIPTRSAAFYELIKRGLQMTDGEKAPPPAA